jgi:hypothetical protein
VPTARRTEHDLREKHEQGDDETGVPLRSHLINLL